MTEDIAREIIDQATRKTELLTKSAQAFLEWTTWEDVPIRLRAAGG